MALGFQSMRQQFVLDRQEVESDLAGWDGLRQNQCDSVLRDSTNRIACVARPELRVASGLAVKSWAFFDVFGWQASSIVQASNNV